MAIHRVLIPARTLTDESKLSHVVKMGKDEKGLPAKAIYINYEGKPFQLQFGDPTDPEELQPTVKIEPRRHADDVNPTEPTTLGYFVSIPHPDEERCIRTINSYFQHNCRDWFDKPVPAERAKDKVTDCFVEPAAEGQQFSIWAKVNQHPEKRALNTVYEHLVTTADGEYETEPAGKEVLTPGAHPFLIYDLNVQIRQGKAKAVFYTRRACAVKREVVETSGFVFGGKKPRAAAPAPGAEPAYGGAGGGGGGGGSARVPPADVLVASADDDDGYDFGGAGLETSFRTAEPEPVSEHVEVALAAPAPAVESPPKRGRTKH